MRNMISNKCIQVMLVLIAFILGCSREASITTASKNSYSNKAHTYIRNYIDENLTINSQSDGVFTYLITFRLAENSKVLKTTYLNGEVAEDYISKSIKTCLESMNSKKYSGEYQMKIILDLILYKHEIKFY